MLTNCFHLLSDQATRVHHPALPRASAKHGCVIDPWLTSTWTEMMPSFPSRPLNVPRGPPCFLFLLLAAQPVLDVVAYWMQSEQGTIAGLIRLAILVLLPLVLLYIP